MIESEKVSPSKWTDVIPLYDDGEFAVITGHYDGGTTPAYGVRWDRVPNYPDDKRDSTTCGHPEWVLLPPFLAVPMLHTLLAESMKHPRQERFCENILRTIRTAAKRIQPNSLQYAIALYGAQDNGKTMTLNTLIDLLISEVAKAGCDGIIASTNISYNPDTKTGDRCVAIRVFEKLVAIVTFGDDGEAVQKGIDFALRFNADILVAATRKRSDSSSWHTFFDSVVVKTGVPYEAVKKVKVEDPTMAQAQAEKQARELVEKIRLL